MKAALLTELNKPLEIAELEITELQIGQVLVKVLMSGVCGSQLQEIKGYRGNERFLPHPLGHEGVGIVDSVGLGVKNVSVGDKVIMHWRKGVGIESDFPQYMYQNKKISSGLVTTFSEYSIVSENRLTRVPWDTPNELCALLGCSLSTALSVINKEANVQFGESVLVIGCGGVGLNLLQAAKLASAYPIVGVDKNDAKSENVRELGCDYVNSNFFKKLGQFDVIIDTTANIDIINQYSKLLSDTGRLILVGQPPPNTQLNIADGLRLFNGLGHQIKASQGGSVNPTVDFPRYVKLYKAGLLKLNSIISHYFNLECINDALDLLRSGKAGRIMINI